jgi:hypothetical protein
MQSLHTSKRLVVLLCAALVLALAGYFSHDFHAYQHADTPACDFCVVLSGLASPPTALQAPRLSLTERDLNGHAALAAPQSRRAHRPQQPRAPPVTILS